MRRVKKRITAIWEAVSIENPFWEEWWDDFKRLNPVSARITEEFWKKYRKLLNSSSQLLPGFYT